MAQGWITIGVEADTSKFDKQIENLKNKIKKKEAQKEEIYVKFSNIEDEIEKYDKLEQKAKNYEKIIKEIQNIQNQRQNRGLKPVELTAETRQMILDYTNINKELEQSKTKVDQLRAKSKQLENTYDGINDEVAQYEKQIESINIQKQKADVDRLKGSIDNVGNSLGKSIKNAARLTLGIFGIRSAYLALRRASSDLASYDEQYATNLEYIRFVLTQAIAPVLQYIVNLAATLLGYINAIAQAWFGVNLFANGSVEAFNKMKKGATGVGKAVKEIKKQLLGFDEINVLTDQSETGTSAGIGGISPSLDLSVIGGEAPQWLDWIIKNKDLAIKSIEGITAAILSLKYGLGGLKSIGLFLIIDGIVDFINHLNDFKKNQTLSNLGKTIQDIGEVITGLAAFFKSIPLAILGQIISTLGGIVKWLDAIINLIKKPSWEAYWLTVRRGVTSMGLLGKAIDFILNQLGILEPEIEETTIAINDTTKAEEHLKEVTEKLYEVQNEYINSVDRLEAAQEKLKEAQNRTGLSGEKLFKLVEKGTLDYKNMTLEQREVYKAYLNTISAEENLKQTTEQLTQAKKNEKIASLENQLALANESKSFEQYKTAVVDAFNKGEISAEEARDLISKSLSGISQDSRETFVKDLPKDIKDGLNPDNYSSEANKFKKWWNSTFIGGLVTKLKFAIEGNFSVGGGGGSGGGSSGGRAHGGIFYPSKIPRLASGGIVNFPGRGAYYNGAYIGERGAEAVVPLTDNQQMELLGATIGRYITVNANIVNTMNGRVISRELKHIQNEQDFAYNT